MNWSLIRKSILIGALVVGMEWQSGFATTYALGEERGPDSVSTKEAEDLPAARVEIVPAHYNMQHAGAIGLVALGPGWDYGQKRQWTTDFLIGYVPAYDTDRAKVTLTLRQIYTPWKLPVGDKLLYEPLRTGAYVSTTLGKQFWFSAPEKYPRNYYTFSPKVRINIFLGQSVGLRFDTKRSRFDSIKLYADLHSSDLYIISRIQNKYLKFKDYLGLSFGIKLQLKRR